MYDPHHKLNNCKTFRKTFSQLQNRGTIPDPIVNGHNLYHYSLHHKLKCAHFEIDSLENLLTNTPPERIIADINDFSFRVNMSIDGFFYVSGSALDILAREVLTYFGIPLPTDVHYHTARQELTRLRSNDPMIPLLNDPSWKREFSNYRNALTHEVLIGSNLLMQFNLGGQANQTAITVPLPDNPRLDPISRTFIKNPDALKYCRLTFKRLLTKANKIYSEINARMIHSGQLPL